MFYEVKHMLLPRKCTTFKTQVCITFGAKNWPFRVIKNHLACNLLIANNMQIVHISRFWYRDRSSLRIIEIWRWKNVSLFYRLFKFLKLVLSLFPLIICRALAISANVGVGLRSTVYIVFYNTPTLDYTSRFLSILFCR